MAKGFDQQLKGGLHKVDSPAKQFISTGKDEQAASTAADKPGRRVFKERETPEAPEGFYVNPMFIERKTRRIQLVLKPSVYDRAKAMAEAKGLSFNEYVHRALEEVTQADYEEMTATNDPQNDKKEG